MISNQNLTSIRTRLLSSVNAKLDFVGILDRVSFEDYPRLAWFCSQDEKLVPIVFGPIFPATLQELHDWSDLFEQSVEKSMLWIAASVRCYRHKIRNFIDLERQFVDMTLKGRHKDAGDVLDQIEKGLGTSLWLMESRIANLELLSGVKDQKQYTKSITEDESINNIVRTIAYYTSYRAETNVTAERYFDAILKAFKADSDNEYTSTPNVIFRLAFFSRHSFLRLKPILIFEQRTSAHHSISFCRRPPYADRGVGTSCNFGAFGCS
jgi:hypothetical protein